jgi:pyruvate/2-oxoglutarate dehydrogenase complex dihydrolipoamide dehydrogenase (E3) component
MDRLGFDAVVIGAGPAGEVAAGRLAQKGGRKVAIVEQRLVGGECAFYACMPSKALLRPQGLLREAKRVPGVAEALTGPLDAQAVLDRRDEVIAHLDDAGHLPWLQERGVELLRGSGRLVGEREVQVGGQLLQAREAIVIATGSGPLVPAIPGLEEVSAWSNREITIAREPPSRLMVLGGGPVGVEMAQAWASLGSQVSIVEAADRLLPREEPFAGAELATALRELGIAVSLGERVRAARRGPGEPGRETEEAGRKVGETSSGQVETVLELESGAEVSGDVVLVAIGRKPMTEGLGLEAVGLPGEGPIEVDEHLRAGGLDWLYAVGDVNGKALLTHMGKYQARVAADHILGEQARVIVDSLSSPRVTFTDPQIAAVGLTLQQAVSAGIAARAVDVPTSDTAGSSFYGRATSGTSRLVIDEDREVIVGATFAGFEASEFLHAASVAIVAEIPLRLLSHAIPAFPTRSELWLKLLEAYGERYDA